MEQCLQNLENENTCFVQFSKLKTKASFLNGHNDLTNQTYNWIFLFQNCTHFSICRNFKEANYCMQFSPLFVCLSVCLSLLLFLITSFVCKNCCWCAKKSWNPNFLTEHIVPKTQIFVHFIEFESKCKFLQFWRYLEIRMRILCAKIQIFYIILKVLF